MLGGHLDSWHSATGATDNAIGCAVMMEAARILKALGVKPRRTIRVALWSGEEQGLLGLEGLREGALRHLREPEAGVREVRRLLQRRFRHGPHPRRQRIRPEGRRGRSARGVRAVRGLRRDGRLDHAQPPHRRHRQHVVQRGGAPGHRPEPGPDRVPAATPGTPTSTPTNASSRTTCRSRRSRLPPPSITWPCATRCCRGSARKRCRRRLRRRLGVSSIAEGGWARADCISEWGSLRSIYWRLLISLQSAITNRSEFDNPHSPINPPSPRLHLPPRIHRAQELAMSATNASPKSSALRAPTPLTPRSAGSTSA